MDRQPTLQYIVRICLRILHIFCALFVHCIAAEEYPVMNYKTAQSKFQWNTSSVDDQIIVCHEGPSKPVGEAAQRKQ